MPVYKCRTLISTPHDLLRVTGRVPRLSSVYPRVKMLAARSDVPLRQVEREIMRDPAICARLPRLAHILYPALGRGANTITAVLSILGGERIKHLLLITAVAAAFGKIKTSQFDMPRFWRLAARRALLARLLALEAPHVDPTRAFVAGLLGDIGHLVLHLGIPAPAQDAQTRAAQCGLPVNEVETALLGFDYAQVGAVLMRRWRHCHVIENAIEYQTRPLTATESRGDACVLHIATQLAEAIESGADVADWGGSVRAAVWAMSGRSFERLASIVALASADFDELLQVLSPATATADVRQEAPVPIAQARAKVRLHLPAAAPSLFERKAG